MNNELTLTLKDVNKVFNPGEWNEITAVNNVSFQLFSGEYVLLIGENGSGKSTLINLISGHYTLTSGEIFFNKNKLHHLPPYKRSDIIYRIHQNPLEGLSPVGTVAENISFSLKKSSNYFSIKKLFDKSQSHHFQNILCNIRQDIADKLNHKVYTLSPGQQQALALSLLALQNTSNKILLADEPTAGLDPETKEKCLSIIKKKADEGWLCLMVTHSKEIINSHSGRILKITNGSLLEIINGNK